MLLKDKIKNPKKDKVDVFVKALQNYVVTPASCTN